ncbi:MAG: acetyl-CoA carboxylase biotin carboxylase subunit [Chloroflexota bacterium]
MFERILIANRGEIALRILRACQDLGIQAVVGYSEVDRDSLPVRLADQAVCIGPGQASRSYNYIPSIISAALATGCDAIHPGYGFLSENVTLAEICREVGVVFIGPEPESISTMSDKAVARTTAQDAGVPILPGTKEPLGKSVDVRALQRDIGFPMLLKASAGGGGRGMRVANDERELLRLLPLAQAEAQSAFANGAVYAERYLERPRHIEVQILADRHGHVLSLGERDCSMQRRHQKLVEESPAPGISKKLRSALQKDAVKLAREINYVGVGTFEFLVDEREKHYFIEANTRIQVEHPVTEQVTGLDLIDWQIRVAAGEMLDFEQKHARYQGHAIECRVNAEDPAADFAPSVGVVDGYLAPGGIGVRVDSHLYPGYVVPSVYDSLLGKIITWGPTREIAIARMQRALAETVIDGISTTIPFLQHILASEQFATGEVHTRVVNELMVTSKEDQGPRRSGLAMASQRGQDAPEADGSV